MPPCEDTLSPNIQRSTQAAGDAPGNSWVSPTKLRVFPGCLPVPGSKRLCLSQRCSLIYPLALCFSLPLSLPHSLPLHLSDRLLHCSLSLMLSFILLTHSPNQHFPHPQVLLKWTNGHCKLWGNSTFLAFVVHFPTHFLLIFLFHLYWKHWFIFLSTLQLVLCFTLIESIAFNCPVFCFVSCLYVCLRVCFCTCIHMHCKLMQRCHHVVCIAFYLKLILRTVERSVWSQYRTKYKMFWWCFFFFFYLSLSQIFFEPTPKANHSQ